MRLTAKDDILISVSDELTENVMDVVPQNRLHYRLLFPVFSVKASLFDEK